MKIATTLAALLTVSLISMAGAVAQNDDAARCLPIITGEDATPEDAGACVRYLTDTLAGVQGQVAALENQIAALEASHGEIQQTLDDADFVDETAESFRNRAVELEVQSVTLEGQMVAAARAAEASRLALQSLTDQVDEQVGTITAEVRQRLDDAADELERLRSAAGTQDLARNPDFVRAIAELVEPVPTDIVVASLIPCADLPGRRWSEYEPAMGRFILGVSEQYPIARPGGEEEVRLSIEHMVQHSHDLGGVIVSGNVSDGLGVAVAAQHNQGPEHGLRTEAEFLGEVVPPASISIMPPYIALYWCTPE